MRYREILFTLIGLAVLDLLTLLGVLGYVTHEHGTVTPMPTPWEAIIGALIVLFWMLLGAALWCYRHHP